MSGPMSGDSEPKADEPWYVTAFRADYRAVYPGRDLPAARREAGRIVEVGIEGRVLDLCCGFGRHSLALLELGLDVYGVDLSAELLAQAGDLPGGAALEGRLVRADARAVPFASATFDGLVNLFSSFGYFGPEGDLEVLDEIARLLRPGGRAILDLMNPPLVRSNLVPHSSTERDGARLLESRVLRQAGRWVTKDVRLSLPSGEERRWREEVRLYETHELAELLAPRGLEITDVDGDFSGAPYDELAPRQIVRLRRR